MDVLDPEVEDRAQFSPEIREILNYVIAAEAAFSWVEDRPLTSGFIGNLQRALVEGTAGEFDDAGGPRNRLVLIGPRDAPIEEARFIPAPFGDQLRAGLDQWVEWVNALDRELPAVVQAALAHYQFETLHPFSDGNGRIGRLCIVLQLMRLRVLRHPILVVSPWFEARRIEYQDHLLRLSQTGDWDAWVRFFATGVGSAAATTHQRIDELLSWQEHALKVVRDAGVSGVAERLTGELAGTPILRANQVAAGHAISHQGAMNALRRLSTLGLLREGRRNGQIAFYADDVVALLGQ